MKKNTRKHNSGDHNSGDRNSGNHNSGHHNSGDRNSGHRNSGDHNSGHCNSRHHNSGDHNSGDRNSGHCNSGNYNSGHCNSGNHNSGHHNSGDRNSGHRNSGDHNSGHCNSGHCNSGDRNSGFFNTDEPTVRMFNKDTNLKRSDIDMPYIYLKTTEWIPEEKMTTKQKKNDPDFHIKGGTLIKRNYKEAWQLFWNETDQKTKDKFLKLPNFDAEIFEEITGINVNKESCNGKIVEIEGKKYKLQEI